MIKKFCNSALAAIGLMLVSLPAAAECTLGHKSCRSGSLWVCERCGSETCWIFKGTRCAKDDDGPLPAQTNERPLLRLIAQFDRAEMRLPAKPAR